jgi:hypothetical protein
VIACLLFDYNPMLATQQILCSRGCSTTIYSLDLPRLEIGILTYDSSKAFINKKYFKRSWPGLKA